MRKVNARSIEIYSRCPKKAQYLWNVSPDTGPFSTVSLISQIIKSAYVFQARKGKFPPFKLFTNWIEQFLGQQLLETSSYTHNKELLVLLSYWYNKLYLEKYYDDAVVNLPVSLGLGTHLTYYDKIDLVTIGNKIRFFDFKEVGDIASLRAYNGTQIYNDFTAQIHLWSFWKASGLVPDSYVRLVIGKRAIKDVTMQVTKNTLLKTEGYIKQITRGIQDDAFYPSFSEQCTYCSFAQQCSI